MRRLTLSLFALTATLTAAPALAEPVFCTARINDRDVVMAYDPAEARQDDSFTRRQALAARVGRHDCPSYVVLRSLTPELTDEERQPFCLRHDKASDSVIGYDLGARDSLGQCRAASRSVCRRVNQTTAAANALTGAAARRSVQGLQALPDGSGAVILNGTGSAISGALASLGGAAAAVAASPVLLTGAAVSVVAVGGTLYACREED